MTMATPSPAPAGDPEIPDVDEPTRRQRFILALSSPTARAVSVLLAIGALFLAVYVELSQQRLTDCIADYNNAVARRSAIVTRISEEDRALDVSDRAANDADRVADAATDAAADLVYGAIAGRKTPQEFAVAFAELIKARAHERATFAANQKIRTDNAAQRREHEEERRRNPLPAPPAQQCG